MKIFKISWFFTLLLLLAGCNKDDVHEIFSSGQTWHWSGSYSTSDWKDDNNCTSTLTRDELARINDDQDKYTIIFKEDGTVEGKGSSFTFIGTWSANGDDQSFSIQLKPNGNRSGLDKTFYDEISSAKFYRGSSRLIKLFNLDKNHYIQFYPKGFND
ncbi:DUF4847 family protein [Bacteroides mediterraneensis]|uniref:DUF4847 family protein n=1 Tax=Bacteroides mediterraneensis TaxID=1841856 RepID=UPI0026F2A1F9|nr:DUF4847 family protein [Bacteroides mediterraneensis]